MKATFATSTAGKSFVQITMTPFEAKDLLVFAKITMEHRSMDPTAPGYKHCMAACEGMVAELEDIGIPFDFDSHK